MIFNSKCHSVKALKTPLLELEKDHDLGYQIFQKFVFLVGMATPPHFLYPSMNAKKRINFFMTISQTADETGMIHFTVTSMFFKNKMR